MKKYLFKNNSYSLFINQYGTMILIYRNHGNIAVRPQVDRNWHMIATSTGVKVAPQKIKEIVKNNLK